jgi:mono/diheme cytochrome c family protein
MNTSNRTAIRDLIRNASLALLLFGVLAMPLIGNSAQIKANQKKAPEALAVTGRKLFVNNCAACHGTNAQGDDGPNLRGLKMSDATIQSLIVTGFKGQMPSFKLKLKAPDIKALISYLRTLKK